MQGRKVIPLGKRLEQRASGKSWSRIHSNDRKRATITTARKRKKPPVQIRCKETGSRKKTLPRMNTSWL